MGPSLVVGGAFAGGTVGNRLEKSTSCFSGQTIAQGGWNMAVLSGKPTTWLAPSPFILSPLAHAALFSFNTQGCFSPR